MTLRDLVPLHPDMKQRQVHSGSGGRPALSGSTSLAPVLPADRLVDTPGELVIFTPEDVEQALAIYRASAHLDTRAAIREVLLFALRIAAINLDIR